MPEQTTIRGVIYCRKSNDDNEDSVKQQDAWAREAMEREGITLAHAPFVDQAIKGWATETRSDLHAMLEFCQEERKRGRRISVIVCWDTDRFSRSDSNETGSFIWDFRQCGTSRMFAKTDGWLDFSRAEHRLLFNVKQDMMNHQYVRNLAQNSTRGRITGALDGRWQGGDIPYGYRPEKEWVTKKGITKERTARLVLGPDAEVRIVKEIFQLYRDGFGQRAIADRLNSHGIHGIPSPRGKMWGTNTVKRILNNPVYLGRLTWARRREGIFFAVVETEVTAIPEDGTAGRSVAKPEKTWIKARKDQTHDPIIDLDTWQACQQRRQKRQKEKTPRMGSYPLSGIVVCGECGVNMTARVQITPQQNGRIRTYRRVQCASYNRSGKSRCTYNAVDADDLTDAVWSKLHDAITQPDIELAVCEEACRRKEMAQTGDEQHLAALRVTLADLERKVRYAQDRCCDPANKDIFASLKEGLVRCQQAHDAIRSEVEAHEQAAQPAIDFDAEEKQILEFLHRVKEMSDEERVNIIREMVAYVVLFFERSTAR